MTARNTRLLDSPEPRQHLVQFYADDDRALAANVSRYLAQGLRCGEAALAVATAEHRDSFLRGLENAGVNVTEAVLDQRLHLLDAQTTISAIMVDGSPDWGRFDSLVGGIVESLRGRPPVRGLRAYGEMVGLLWQAGESAAAIRLEEYWNRLLGPHGFSLFCAYPIDIFGQDFKLATVDAILCAHSHLLSSDGSVEVALNRAMAEVLGPRLEGLRPLMKANYRPSWAALPPAESVILWLRNNLSTTADEILARAAQYHRRSRLQLHTSSAE
jgi:MEDS: MEthanogen/methylotroph, DcmR Sensory domain